MPARPTFVWNPAVEFLSAAAVHVRTPRGDSRKTAPASATKAGKNRPTPAAARDPTQPVLKTSRSPAAAGRSNPAAKNPAAPRRRAPLRGAGTGLRRPRQSQPAYPAREPPYAEYASAAAFVPQPARNKAGVRAGRGTACPAQAPRYAAVQPNKPCQRAKKPVRRRTGGRETARMLSPRPESSAGSRAA